MARGMVDRCMFAEGAEHEEETSATGDTARLDVLIPPGDLAYSPRADWRGSKTIERSHVAVDPVSLTAGSHHGATYYQHVAFAAAVRGERRLR